jgi:hypothetical protein
MKRRLKYLPIIFAITLSGIAVAHEYTPDSEDNLEDLTSSLQQQEPRVNPGDELVSAGFRTPISLHQLALELPNIIGCRRLIIDSNINRHSLKFTTLTFSQPTSKKDIWQAFLGELDRHNLTTVETGSIIRVLKVRREFKLVTYYNPNFLPKPDEFLSKF